MKRYFALALAVVMILLAILGCASVSAQDQGLQRFQSVEAFQQWLDSKPLIFVAGDDGIVKLNDGCTYMAEGMQKEAWKDGYLISIQVIRGGYLLGVKVSTETRDHMGLLAVIGNNIYYAEPLDRKITLVGNR